MATAQRDILADFGHLRDAAVAVSQMLRDIRSHLTNVHHNPRENVELEARLGRLQNNRFESNVGQTTFLHILQLLESYPRWTRSSAWQETHDVFYNVELPASNAELLGAVGQGGKAVQVRTTVGSDGHGGVTILHNTKRRLRSVDLEMRLMDAFSCTLDTNLDGKNDGLDVRVAANVETVVAPEGLPIAVMPSCVRIKQRKRFFLSSLGIDNETFVYELSVVYQGRSKHEAEQKQSNRTDPSFEVEIECLQPRAYLRSSNGEDLMLALSMLLKCFDFAMLLHPQSNVTYVPQALKSYDQEQSEED